MAVPREQLREWQREVSPGEGWRARIGRGAWAAAGQREPSAWSWRRALPGLAGVALALAALVAAGLAEPTALVGATVGYAWMIALAHRLHLRYTGREPRRLTGPQVGVIVAGLIGLVAVVGLAVRDVDDRQETVGRALGAEELTGADAKRIERFFAVARPLGSQYTELVRRLNDENSTTPQHREAVDAVDATLSRMRAAARGFDDPDVQATLAGYVADIGGVVGAIDRAVALDERGDATDEEYDAVVTEVQEKSRVAERAEKEFLDRLAAQLPEDERERLLEDHRRRVQEFEEARDGG